MPILWCSLCLALAQWIGYMNIQYVRIMGMMLALYLLRGSKSIDPGSLTSVLRYPVIIIILLFGIVALSYILCVIGYARKKPFHNTTSKLPGAGVKPMSGSLLYIIVPLPSSESSLTCGCG